jgi:nitrous oxidase accessory protein
VSELRHQPAGLVEALVKEQPTAAVFTRSPAFRAIRTAEQSLPVIDAPGVVDYHPLTTPPHEHWREYYERDRDD